MRIAALIATLGVATVLMGASIGPSAYARAASPFPRLNPIQILAPASVMAGSEICFDVVTLGGPASVLAESNEVKLPLTAVPGGGDNSYTTRYCGRVPAGAGGGTIVITAISATGAVATVTVSVI